MHDEFHAVTASCCNRWCETSRPVHWWHSRLLLALILAAPEHATLRRYTRSEQKNFNSLQRYVRAIWVKTRKQQKWFWRYIIACWIPDWPLL